MSRSREFLDTNVVVYAFSDDPRSEAAQSLLATGCAISVQVLNEFANVARRKLNMSWQEMGVALNDIHTLCRTVVPLKVETHFYAIELAERYGFSIFDALMVAATLQNGGETLWSEDMQNNLVVDGRVTIRNPFGSHE
ncbi:ribonuclease VapC [Brucella endophytica]|uniref:Ribonuclease VapC n=1 Tax=Brucella endophytica TaxID=1963359 RepID=A0A916SJI2_9HYPH|nr:PIN domain-containing protein [Brucella endophytica]GGB02264.1 ribonuclease VapC [Brucella endophytica]